MLLANWRISRKLIAAFGLIIVSFAGVAAMVMVNMSAIEAETTESNRVLSVISKLDTMTKAMLDLSGQVRGYLLTRDEAYAHGVETDKADVKKQFEALRAQVQSPERQAMLAAVERAANGFIDEAAQPEIRLARDPSTFNQGLDLMTSGIGKRWMNDFKETVKTLSGTETDLRSRSAAERDKAMASARVSLVGGAAGALVIAALMCWVLTRKIAAPVDAMAEAISNLASSSVQREAATKAQTSLDVNLTSLREILYGHGRPYRKDGKLYFGDYLANANNDVVDHVQSRFGGTATIFLDGVRVATNVLQQDGSRATGTTLAHGPAYDAALNNAKMYRGEAKLFDKTYVTLYEPIIDGTDVIGILYVGVLMEDVDFENGTSSIPSGGDEVVRMQSALATLERAIIAKDEAESSALEQRYLATDRARQATALSQVVAADQKLVVLALSTALESLAGTDLTHRIETAFPAEYQGLKTNFAAAVTILHETMRTISTQTSTIFSVTGEIAHAVDDLSRRTEQQAASLEETAAALDEITVNVKQTADGAHHAREVVAETRTDAERSGEVVRQAVTAMGNIQNSSQQISQIIGVIDEIAFQTNLLALNAGVEAARAGEAGRGFAVVASEVRALAQRSAEAAKEIKTLISTSGQHVELGVKLVGETGVVLQRILTQVAEISSVISNIAASTKEQASGLGEVNAAINQMDQVTQQNAAMVEQSAAAGRSLAQETEELKRLIDRFRIDGGGRVVPLKAGSAARSAPSGARPSARSGSLEAQPGLRAS